MKYFFIIISTFPIWIGCAQQKKCSAHNFFLLKDSNLQRQFFQKLDSILQFQYPNLKEKENMDINPEILQSFLKDIDTSLFVRTNTFTKKYKFKLIPQGITAKNYNNTLQITFYPTACYYRLVIINWYETDQYFDESSIVYSFRIKNKEITDFKRQEAG